MTETKAVRAGRSWLPLLLAQRHGAVFLFVGLFVAISTCTRVALLIAARHSVSWDTSLVAAFGWGALFDLAAAALASLPLSLALSILPSGRGHDRFSQLLAHLAGFVAIAVLLFGGVAEWTFWEEFGVRFNFIAVDYLVYTTEVIGNIRESYNLPLILAALALAAALGQGLLSQSRAWAAWRKAPRRPYSRSWRTGALYAAGALLLGLGLNEGHLPSFKNNYNRELGKNGLWSLFAAFRNNELDYQQFYRTLPDRGAFIRIRSELSEDGSQLPIPDDFDTLRQIVRPGPELRLNVIQVTVESLSASFLGCFNAKSSLTPELDALAEKSLVFENVYATGTRTDRGMEALTLSLPPTPGRSIVKRPGNDHLFTLGSVFRNRGYDTAFLYGGYGYFDNMNAFFGGNGYRIVDRASTRADDVSFANAWGACDEDLYRWTLREADGAHASGRPFHFFAMTTSNHRPFTYPEGRIDLPPKTSGRDGAVKYTDFALGQFLRAAATRPWFKQTVFVIVADHCASSAGKTELPVENYHIPLMIYAPGGQIAPGRIQTLASQIDVAPTLLGLLNWSYPSRFFGHDVRRINQTGAHALIGTYQKLGHLEKGELTVLSPRQGLNGFLHDARTDSLTQITPTDPAVRETISYYQTASYLFHHGLYREVPPESAEAPSVRITVAPAARLADNSRVRASLPIP